MKKIIYVLFLLIGIFNANTAFAVNCGDTINTTTTLTHTPVHSITQACCTTTNNPALTIIGNSSIIVDLNGFEIQCCNPSIEGIKIIGNVTLKNGTVRGCSVGISATGRQYTISKMTAVKNATHGFVTNAPNVAPQTKIILEENMANNNGDNGFANYANKGMSLASQITFKKNIATGNTNNGFYNEGQSVIFSMNTSSVNGRTGFFNEKNSTFINNIANRNGAYGFYANGRNSSYTNNVATNNRDSGIRVNSQYQTFNNTMTTDNGLYGIYALSSSSSNFFDYNFSSGNNAIPSSYPDINDNGLGNTWNNNECEFGNISC